MFIIQSIKVTLFLCIEWYTKGQCGFASPASYASSLHLQTACQHILNWCSEWLSPFVKMFFPQRHFFSLVTGLFFFFFSCSLNSVAHWPINLLQDCEKFAGKRTHTSAQTHKYTHTHIYVYTYIYTHINIILFEHKCIHTTIHTNMSNYICICIYTCKQIYTYTHMNI